MKKIISFLLSAALISGMGSYKMTNMEVHGIQPNPVISRNVPAYSGNSGTASAGNDDFYYTQWSASASDYLAYDLSGIPVDQRKKVIAVWYNLSSYDAIGSYVSRNAEPSDYTIEVNAAEGGSYPEDGWEVVEQVTDNGLSSRQHLVNMEGYNWIRLNVAKSDGRENGNITINFDIHNVSEGVEDSWIFFGDSITAGGMNNAYGTGFATFVNKLDPRFFPVQENGGIGGITSVHGCENIERWLSTYPGKYVSVAYGTNDAWGNQTGAEKYYDNTKYMIDRIIASGKMPVLPKIPYALEPGVNQYLDSYNEMIDRLYDEYGDKLIQGPDFDNFFRENPEYLSGDGVHPNSEGYEAMRKEWAETMYQRVYSLSDKEYEIGDVNTDGEINVADLVKMQEHILEKITLNEAQIKTADMDSDKDINTLDAALLRKKLVK